jgi:hypothetical protein
MPMGEGGSDLEIEFNLLIWMEVKFKLGRKRKGFKHLQGFQRMENLREFWLSMKEPLSM